MSGLLYVAVAVCVYLLIGVGCALTVAALGRIAELLDDYTVYWTFWGALIKWPVMLYYIARPEKGVSA